MDSIQCFSLAVKVGQVEKLRFEMVHEARLDRVIVVLSLNLRSHRFLGLSKIVKLQLWLTQFRQNL